MKIGDRDVPVVVCPHMPPGTWMLVDMKFKCSLCEAEES